MYASIAFLVSLACANANDGSYSDEASMLPGAVSLATDGAGKLMRVNKHPVSQTMAQNRVAAGSTSWTASASLRKGAIKIKGNTNKCLMGVAAGRGDGPSHTMVQTGNCTTHFMRFFFHFAVATNQTKFCNPRAAKSGEGVTESLCRWKKCLEAETLSHGGKVKRKTCTNPAHARQKWEMP